MSDQQRTFLITGAARGLGTDLTRAALAAGHRVAATARRPEAITDQLGEQDRLLAVRLDITRADDAKAAVQAAVERFGAIDVLVNNAGNFFAGFFEELSSEEVESQIATNLLGPMTVTRAVLPAMRAQRSGHIVTLSSIAGLVGQEFCSAYAASKFGLEGWMESLAPEIAPFGIRSTLVEPGFFRTELLSPESTSYAEASIDDYAERTERTVAAWQGMSGQQAGDPVKLAEALLEVIGLDAPPARWVAGEDAVATAERKARDLLEQIGAHRDLSTRLAHDDAPASAAA